MSGAGRRVFASRRISLPSIRAIAIVVVVGFVAGIGVGWGSGVIADQLAGPVAVPTPTPTPSPTLTSEGTVPPMAPITRDIDEDDALAGITSLDIVTDGDQTYTVASGNAEPSRDAASVRWVRVEYETGLGMDDAALSTFVLDTLNDPRSWGARGRFEFVPTDGASDLRVVVASPATAAAMCPEPHQAAPASTVTDEDVDSGNSADAPVESQSQQPSAGDESGSGEEEVTACAARGLIVISQYDWVAGLLGYDTDRTAARQYLINHFVGHAFGNEDGICASGVAQIMTDQARLPDDCDPNAWPWPDEPPAPNTPSVPATPPATEGDEEE